MSPIVVKLGGSLAKAGTLSGWLDGLCNAEVPLVIVPGGGAFADAVRAAQAKHGFDDLTAHRMALLAMHQMGLMLAALRPARLVTAETLPEITQALDAGRLPVWLPGPLAGAATDIAADWSLTSDGLAAWLAAMLGARAVWLVKSVRVGACPGATGESPGPATRSLADLATAGIVDPEFARIVTERRLAWRILGPGEETTSALFHRAPTAEDAPAPWAIDACRNSGLRPGFDE